MSDMITAEEAGNLLDGKLEGVKLAYSSNGEGVIYIAPTENRDSAVAIPVRDKNMGWHKANPEVYMALIDRFNAAPDLARTVIALHADRDRLAAANAALEAQVARLVGALEALRHAVCGETGFASCVRADSGKAYPWPALDEAEALVNAALAEVQADARREGGE